MFVDPVDALKQAIALVNPHATNVNTPGVGSYTDTYS
jgi:SulP family sulfate permease